MAVAESPRVLMGSRRATLTTPPDAAHTRLLSAMQLTALPPDALASPGDVVVLHASHNKLREVFAGGAGAAMTRLEELHVGWNDLAALPAAMLPALTVLSVPHNHLTSLPPDLAALFPRLRVLDLSRNKLASLPPRTPRAPRPPPLTRLLELARLTALEHLDVSGNALTALPAEIAQLSALQVLSVRCNRLATLPPEIGALGALRHLSLRCNELSLLPAEIGQLTALRLLCARSNALTHIPATIGQLTALRELDLFDNKLSLLPLHLCKLTGLVAVNLKENPLDPGLAELVAMGTFALLFYLRKHYDLNVSLLAGAHFQNFPPKCRFNESIHRQLDLSASNLSALPEGLADALYLQQLDVSINRLADLSGSILFSLTSLTHLNVRANQLASLPTELTRLANLAELNVSYNLLTSLAGLHDASAPWRHLAHVDASHNRVAALPAQLSERTPVLRHLDLGHNVLTHLPAELARCSQLEHLCVSFNQLDALPPSLTHLAASLSHLDASHNNLGRELKLDLRQFSKLRFVDLRQNRIQHLASESRDPPPSRVAFLALSFNRISFLHPAYAQLGMLASLHASHCNLSYLPPLAGLHSLTAADFSFNRITAVPRTVGTLTTLTELNLASNLLVSLPAELAALAPSLRTLALHGNPLTPDLLVRSPQPALLFSYLQSLSETALADLDVVDVPRVPDDADGPGVLDWSVERVAEWLVRLRLAVYREPFRAAEVTGAVLVQLTDEQLSAHLHVSSRHLDLLRRHIDHLRAPLSLMRVSQSRTSPQRSAAPALLSPKRGQAGSTAGVPVSFLVGSVSDPSPQPGRPVAEERRASSSRSLT